MNNLIPVLLALLVGAAAMFLLRGEEPAPTAGADPQLVSALSELRQEVSRLREQIAAHPQLVLSGPSREGTYPLPGVGIVPGLREPDDEPPPPPPLPPGQDRVIPPAGPVEHAHRKGPRHPLSARTEADNEVLRTLSTRHEDEEEHEEALRAWLLVQEQEVLRRFGLPDTIRTDGGTEVWVYEGLFGRDNGREVHLRFSHGRLIGVH